MKSGSCLALIIYFNRSGGLIRNRLCFFFFLDNGYCTGSQGHSPKSRGNFMATWQGLFQIVYTKQA